MADEFADYAVRRQGDELLVSREGVEERVPISGLPSEVQQAVRDEQYDDEALRSALRGVISAVHERGG